MGSTASVTAETRLKEPHFRGLTIRNCVLLESALVRDAFSSADVILWVSSAQARIRPLGQCRNGCHLLRNCAALCNLPKSPGMTKTQLLGASRSRRFRYDPATIQPGLRNVPHSTRRWQFDKCAFI